VACPHPQPGPEVETQGALETLANAAQPRATTRPLASLSVEEVGTVLANLVMAQHAEAIHALLANCEYRLDCLDEEELQEAGLEKRARKALLQRIRGYQTGGVPLELLVSFIDRVAGASSPLTTSGAAACTCFVR